MTFRRRSLFPRTLAECIEPLARPILKTQGLAGTHILTQWASIAGPSMASHCCPEKLSFPKGKKSGGTLTISCQNGFATELQHLQPVLIERINAYFGYPAVTRIAISHSWPQTPAAKKPALKPTLPASCLAAAQGIEDEELKHALASLARAFSGQAT